MALLKCKECGQRISSKAKACPSCGKPHHSNSGCYVLILLVFIGVIILIAFDFRRNDGIEQSLEQDSLGANGIVTEYLAHLGLRPGNYKRIDDEGGDERYLAVSPYVEFGNNVVSMHCYGTAYGVETILVSAGIVDTAQKQEAVDLVVEASETLYTSLH